MNTYGKVHHMRNAYGYCFDLYEMEDKPWKNCLLYSYRSILKHIGSETCDEYLRNVFYMMFEKIVKDVMQTGNMFTGMFGSYLIQIYMKQISGEKLKEMVRDGYFKNADLASLGYVAYYPYMNILSASRKTADVIINLSEKYDKMLDELLNEGMIYEHSIQTRIQSNKKNKKEE